MIYIYIHNKAVLNPEKNERERYRERAEEEYCKDNHRKRDIFIFSSSLQCHYGGRINCRKWHILFSL